MVKYIIALVTILLTSCAQILLKKGADVFSQMAGLSLIEKVAKIITNPFVIGGFALYGFSSFLWLYVLSKMKLSVAYPLVSLSYVIVAIASYYLFGEQLVWSQKFALMFIVIGVIMMMR